MDHMGTPIDPSDRKNNPDFLLSLTLDCFNSGYWSSVCCVLWGDCDVRSDVNLSSLIPIISAAHSLSLSRLPTQADVQALMERGGPTSNVIESLSFLATESDTNNNHS